MAKFISEEDEESDCEIEERTNPKAIIDEREADKAFSEWDEESDCEIEEGSDPKVKSHYSSPDLQLSSSDDPLSDDEEAIEHYRIYKRQIIESKASKRVRVAKLTLNSCLSNFSTCIMCPILVSKINFGRLGARVPTFLISPWIEKGTEKLAEVKGSLRPWRAREDSKLSEFQVELIQLASQLVGDHLLNSYPDIGKNMTVSEGNKYAEDAVQKFLEAGMAALEAGMAALHWKQKFLDFGQVQDD